jgi:hypothetical protein
MLCFVAGTLRSGSGTLAFVAWPLQFGGGTDSRAGSSV